MCGISQIMGYWLLLASIEEFDADTMMGRLLSYGMTFDARVYELLCDCQIYKRFA